MREVKFRAWDKITKQIFEVKQIDFNAIERNIYGDITTNSIFGKSDTELQWRSFDKAELMQFTGLKDCNGKEIYEGDIVKFTYNGLFLKGEVVFSNGGWELKGVDYGEHFRLVEIVHLCEVIGNIFENPELIGGKK